MWGNVASTKKDLRAVSLSKKSFAIRYVKIPTPKAESPETNLRENSFNPKGLAKTNPK
jgi:hypothetical protein